jgi:hypothetical protein
MAKLLSKHLRRRRVSLAKRLTIGFLLITMHGDFSEFPAHCEHAGQKHVYCCRRCSMTPTVSYSTMLPGTWKGLCRCVVAGLSSKTPSKAMLSPAMPGCIWTQSIVAFTSRMPAVGLANRLFALEGEIKSRGLNSRLKLAALLKSDNRFVRYYTAQELYGLLPDQCRPISEKNTKEFDAIAGDARGFLRAIDDGSYKPQ